MSPVVIALIAFAVIGLLVLMYGVGIYNTLVRLRNRFENAFSQIEVQLKRRYDLIPNLVETVKASAHHEEETLTKVAEAAPRESASIASAPLPAKRSRQSRPSSHWPSQLNSVSRTRSGVGRRSVFCATGMRRPRYSPAIIRTLPLLDCTDPW